MPIVAGLGNVGERYDGTRHNVGFEVVRELARRWHARWIDSGATLVARGEIAGRIVVLAQPQLLMNCSGEALARLDPARLVDDLTVVHDEIDLPLGRIRIKLGGGSAGHRGVGSVAAHYGPGFTRVRVGVGRPVLGEDVAEYVLERFADHEQPVVRHTVHWAADAVECLIVEGRETAMLRFNGQATEPRPPEAAPATGKGEGAQRS